MRWHHASLPTQGGLAAPVAGGVAAVPVLAAALSAWQGERTLSALKVRSFTACRAVRV